MKRGIVLLMYLMSAMALLFDPGAVAQSTQKGFLYQPDKGGIWDPTVIYVDGKYYMFCMYGGDSVFMSSSTDGVHWQDHGVVLKSEGFKNNRVWKQYVSRVGDKFIMDFGAFTDVGTNNNLMRFYGSSDLIHWQHLYDVPIDPQFYHTDGRWDHMFTIPKDGKDSTKGTWGYLVADPLGHGGFGMMESADGIHYHPIKAPDITADFRIPTMEVGGVKKFGDKYYVIGGNVNHYGFNGYGVYTFVADNPTGPFHPDLEDYRLTGTSGKEDQPYVHVLACFVRDSPDDLVSDPFTFSFGGRRDPRGTWLLPLRKAIVDPQGHLHLAYWKQNDLAKGNTVAVDSGKTTILFPPGQTESTQIIGVQGKDDAITVDTGSNWNKYPWLAGNETRKAVVVLNQRFDFDKGIVVEGKLKVKARLARMLPVNGYGDSRDNYAGFFIESSQRNTGTGIMLQIGEHAWRTSKIGVASFGTTFDFDTQDLTGAHTATVNGLDDGSEHTFRLWIRGSQVELYIDDLLMQSYFISQPSGRIGFLVQEANVVYSDLKVYELNL